jgi:integrase
VLIQREDAMTVAKITVESVKAVSIPVQGKREYLWDEEVKGFGLMVTDKGVRSYILQYRIGGRGAPTRRVTLGKHGSPWTPTTARKRALELLEQVRRKVDPFDAEREAVAVARAAKVQAKALSVIETRLAFDKIAKNYISKGTWVDGTRIRSWSTYERIIERDLKPSFGSTPLTRISSDDITELLIKLEDRGPSAARRAHIVLTNIFSFATRAEKRHFKPTQSPMLEVHSPDQSAVRDHHLSDAELRLVWKAAGDMGWPWCEIIRLLILTGQRLREVAHVPWTELNVPERSWIIGSLRAKNGDAHLVPITDSALAIWSALPSIKNDADLVFPSSVGTPLSAISKMKRKLDAKILALMKDEAKEAGSDPAKVKLEDWRLHDLRRTASVGMQRQGVPREVIDEVLNHRTGGRTGITGVYQVYRFKPEKADALARWDSLVKTILEGGSNVVQFRGVA